MNALVEVFNRYVEKGGEELIADKILETLSTRYAVESLRWSSADWKGAAAPSKFSQFARMFHNGESARRLRDLVSRHRPGAIIAHNVYPVGSPSIYREARRLSVPVLQFTHNFRPFSVNGTLWVGDGVESAGLRGRFWPEVKAGAWQDSVLKSAILAAVLKWQRATGGLEAVRRWIAISDFMRDTFVEAGIAPERIITLRHFSEPRPEPPVVAEGDYYLFLGRFVREKGILVLLEAWKILHEELGSACPGLVLAGSGPLEPVVREAAGRLPVVRCEGFVDGDRKDRLLSGARSLIAPSIWWEPLGLVTYEAYDNAKPMLAAASGGLRETVEDGRTGYLCTPGSAEALADAVRRAEAAGEAGRREMGQCGREWLLRETSKDRWLESFHRIVAEVAT